MARKMSNIYNFMWLFVLLVERVARGYLSFFEARFAILEIGDWILARSHFMKYQLLLSNS
jgi:uncharacterized membrane protein